MSKFGYCARRFEANMLNKLVDRTPSDDHLVEWLSFGLVLIKSWD